uniref:Migration and invasion inhibitory protein n=1 Tax=Leptobrachium leishanense TaxID=445787 RepID=A0A8C5QLB3_9ANUR
MSDHLEELRQANKCLLDRLKVKNEEFRKLHPIERRPTPTMVPLDIPGGRRPVRDGEINAAVNVFCKNSTKAQDWSLLSVRGHAAHARRSLSSSGKAAGGWEEPGVPKQVESTTRGPSDDCSYRLDAEPGRVVLLQSPVKRLSFLNSSGADPNSSSQYASCQYNHRLTDEGNLRTPKSILLAPRSRNAKRDPAHVTFLSSNTEYQPPMLWASHPPLLGYDWIAGVLELNSPVSDKSDQFFSEIQEFRRVNREECVLEDYYTEAEDLDSVVSEEEADAALNTHECVFCYRVNSRLFPASIGPESACPVCKKRRSRRPQTLEEPAYIRVSIPRSTLLPPYKYRAHRRKSFDPTDSLSLPSHCLAGWENSVPSCEPHKTGLDLKASLDSNFALPETSTSASLGGEPVLVDRHAGDNVSFCSRARSENLLNMSRAAFFQRSKPK